LLCFVLGAAVPRNEKKFGNFVKNSLNVRSDPVVKDIWDFMCSKQAAATAAQDAEHAAADAAPAAAVAEAAEAGDVTKSKKRASEAASDEQKGDDESPSSKGAKAKKSKSEAATSGDIGGALSAQAEEPAKVLDWGKAISKALKAAPGKTLPLKALRKAATAALVALGTEDAAASRLSKAALKAAFKSALKAHPKATQAGKGDDAVVAYQ
jgi:hypothetical protein